MRTDLSVEELCRKLKPVFGKRIDILYLKYSVADSREKKTEIEGALHALYHKYLNSSMFSDKILLEPPAQEMIKGDYPLGKVVYPDNELYPFGLREQDWQRHLCISGMSGSGKTTFAYQILGNLILKKKPFIVFDWKISFRPFIKIDPEVMLFTVGNDNVSNLFKININRPPKGIHPKEWINLLCDIINEAFFASYGVHKVLLETLDQAFKDFGVYGGSENYPTWFQIKDRLEEREAEQAKRTGRESEWLASAARIAHALTFGGFGEALKYKKANMLESRDFKNAILVDEAHNIFLKDRPTFMKEVITDVIYREIREYGTSLICLDQHVSKLSDVVAGNSACNIAFQQMLPQDVDTISGIMQMRDFKLKKYFSMLPVGYAIVKLVERFHSPFLIKAPFIDTKKHPVTDDMIREKMRDLMKYDKRMKVFEESCSVDKLQARIAKTDLMMKSIAVDTGIKEAELRGLTKKDRPKGMYNWNRIIVNHVQEFLFDYACKQAESGFSIEAIHAKLEQEGYNRQDIDIALTNVRRKYQKELKRNASLEATAKEIRADIRLSPEHIALLEMLQGQPGISTSELYRALHI